MTGTSQDFDAGSFPAKEKRFEKSTQVKVVKILSYTGVAKCIAKCVYLSLTVYM